MTPKFSIGYNSDYENFIKLVKKYRNHIESVYLPIPKKYLGSGRIIDQPLGYEFQISNLIRILQEHKIRPFVLLNSTLLSATRFINLMKYLEKLYQKDLFKYCTVTNPYLMIQIKKNMPDVFIESSTLCRIKTVQEGKYFKEIGASRITVDREIIRDLNSLNQLKEILPLKIMVNEGCIKNCIFKYAHYNMLCANIDEISIFSFSNNKKQKIMDEMDSMCVPVVKKHPYKIFSSPFVRPEDLYRYKNITNIFKLSTRNFDTKRIEKTLKSYIKQKHEGNLVEILNSVYIDRLFKYIDNNKLNKIKFFETLSRCDDNCDKCDFCKKLFKKIKVKMK